MKFAMCCKYLVEAFCFDQVVFNKWALGSAY